MIQRKISLENLALIPDLEHIEIDKIIINEKERVRITSGKELHDLMDSIKNLGLFHPILINKDYKLIAGYRRLTACKKLGWKYIPAITKLNTNELEELSIEIQENLRRKDLSPYEVDIAMAKWKRIYEELNPSTKRGAILMNYKQNKHGGVHLKKNEEDSSQIDSMNKEDEEVKRKKIRFTRIAATITNVSERSLRDKIQVGNAILDEKFDKDTILKYKNGNIKRHEMLERDRSRRKMEKMNKHQTKRKLYNEKNLLSPHLTTVKWCKNCKNVRVTSCPECGKQVLICNKGYFLLKKASSQGCGQYLF